VFHSCQKAYLVYRKNFLTMTICLYLNICLNTTFSAPSCSFKRHSFPFLPVIVITQNKHSHNERRKRGGPALGSQRSQMFKEILLDNAF